MSHNYRIGEILRVTVQGQVTRGSDNDGPTVMSLPGGGTFFLDEPSATIERVVPADGEPQPGQMWATTDSTEWYASIRKGFGSGIYLQAPDGRASHWLDVHTGGHGPITLVRPVLAKPEPAEQQLTAADLVGMDGEPIVTVPGLNAGDPVRITRAEWDFDDISVRYQDVGGHAPAYQAGVPATTPIRLVGGA